MHFYCSCLNVTIDALENFDDPQTLADVASLINVTVDWIVCSVSSEQSIHVAWQSLYQTIYIRDVKLNRCLACQQYTHVLHTESNRVLINKDLLNDNTVKSAYRDPNYSQITKIILPTIIPSSPMTRTFNTQDELLQSEQASAQRAYREAIENAESETEEKIRMYQREQEQILERKIGHLNKELETFLSVIRSIPRYMSTAKSSPTLQTSNSYINENSLESGVGSDILETSGTDVSRQSSTIERTPSERASYPDDEINDDSVFDQFGWSTSQGNTFNYATSLPKEIIFRPTSSYTIPQAQEAENSDLERIGKSFRELSQSLMCTDGTELFGDLPSPRVNTRAT